MNLRRYRPIAALAAALALVIGLTVTPAGAGHSTPGQPFTGSCTFALDWQGGYPYPYATFIILGYSAGGGQQGTSCNWRGYVLCGVPSVPSTWHWVNSTWTYSVTQGGNYGYYLPSCGPQYYEVILNLDIVVQAWGALNICWSQNDGNWVYNRGNVPCS